MTIVPQILIIIGLIGLNVLMLRKIIKNRRERALFRKAQEAIDKIIEEKKKKEE